MRLKLKIVPGASSDEVVGWYGDALKVRISAPPERGKANVALLALLASALNVPLAAVQLVAGGASPHKVVEIAGLTDAELRQKLDKVGRANPERQ